MFAALALLALAQNPISWTEDFRSVAEVNVNQGFYECTTDAVPDIAQIARIKDARQRRARAAALGCPIRMDIRKSRVGRVLSVVSNVCEDRRVEDGYTICGNEAHQLVVEVAGKRQTVFWIMADQDLD